MGWYLWDMGEVLTIIALHNSSAGDGEDIQTYIALRMIFPPQTQTQGIQAQQVFEGGQGYLLHRRTAKIK